MIKNYTKYCKDKRKMCEMLINKYQSTQVIVAIEELSELQKELCKHLRNVSGEVSNKKAIIEEIADVEFMLAQMKVYFEINQEDIDNQINWKMERTKERLNLNL